MNLKESQAKVSVVQFFRKVRTGNNYSIEFIFEDVRNRLLDSADIKVLEMPCLSNGFLRRIYNVIYAAFHQGPVNHITGDIHYINLLFNRRKTILTIHDCGPMLHGTILQRAIFKWFWLKIPIWKSKYITTVSEYSKKDIVTYARCAPGKVKVIPVAVSEVFKPAPKAFNEKCPVILQIGTTENKNTLRLMEAISNIPCHLVIIGQLDESKRLKLKQLGISFENKYNLTTEEVYAEYKKCDILSFVSTLEGFGMPIIEANWVERVVIAGSNSSMPEVADGSALLVDASSTEEIRKGILELISNPELREKLLTCARENRLRFLPQKIASQYLELYRDIYQSAN